MSSVSETNKKQPGESKKMITKGEASEALTTKQGWEKRTERMPESCLSCHHNQMQEEKGVGAIMFS